MPGPLQYGPGIKAYVVHLLIAQMLSLKRVAQSMHALIGRTLSEATLLGYLAQLHHALAEWESHAIERLLAILDGACGASGRDADRSPGAA